MNRRILAFIIDYIIVITLFILLSFVPAVNGTYKVFNVLYGIVLILCLVSLLLKDIVKGQSIGKKIMKIKVVNTMGNTPNIYKLILRNITICIWPIEAFRVLLGKRKIGDIWASTDVIDI